MNRREAERLTRQHDVLCSLGFTSEEAEQLTRGGIMNRTYTTQAQVRAAFWEAHPRLEQQARNFGVRSKGQNEQGTECRCAFVEFVESLHRSGAISDTLANRVTL